MELVLIVTIVVSLLLSFCCSLTEAAFYTVPLPHIKHLADSGSRSAKVMLDLKEDPGKPIAAILILNTLANTAGAAIAGAIVGARYGEHGVLVFSIFFTLCVLFFSEIIPKQVGVAHAKAISGIISFPLLFFIRLFSPLIAISQTVSRFIKTDDNMPSISEGEVISMAELGTEEGVLDHLEGSIIRNVIGLDRKYAKDILTPSVVVFRMQEDTVIAEIVEKITTWNYSRVPIFEKDNRENITGYVIQRDIYREIVQGGAQKTLSELRRPISKVPELMRLDKLLHLMFSQGEHICAVIDEHGGFAGVVTLEDLIEEIMGREIVDEYDLVSDLRYYAKVLHQRKTKKKKKKKQ